MNLNFAAHELLETQEALRVKKAEIEQHGAFANQCQDNQLKTILRNHQQRMLQAYQQGINLMQGKGGNMSFHQPEFQAFDTNIGMQQQATMGAPIPNPSALSDQTIATLALSAHKNGSVMSMVWANECVDPGIRHYHVQGAVLCQEMAYEIWQWMNQNGYYQPPRFPQTQVSTMTGMFQPTTSTGTMTGMNNGYYA